MYQFLRYNNSDRKINEMVPTQTQTVKQEHKTVNHLNTILQIYSGISLKINLTFCQYIFSAFYEKYDITEFFSVGMV